MRLIVDGDTIYDKWGALSRVTREKINVDAKAGKPLRFKIDYMQATNLAMLSFDVYSHVNISMDTVMQRVSEADAVVFVGGISPRLEGEEMRVDIDGFKGGDRTHIELPQVQRDILAAIHHMGKPLVFINCTNLFGDANGSLGTALVLTCFCQHTNFCNSSSS